MSHIVVFSSTVLRVRASLQHSLDDLRSYSIARDSLLSQCRALLLHPQGAPLSEVLRMRQREARITAETAQKLRASVPGLEALVDDARGVKMTMGASSDLREHAEAVRQTREEFAHFRRGLGEVSGYLDVVHTAYLELDDALGEMDRVLGWLETVC